MVVIFITGKPGCGKTTLVKEVLKQYRGSTTGILTEEIRRNGRIGFKIIDISTGAEGVLASTEQRTGPHVSKYRINITDLERIALPALNREADLIVIDEIGKMELCSSKVKNTIEKILHSSKNVLASLHRNYVKRYGACGKVFLLTRQNFNDVLSKVIKSLH